MCGIAGLIHRDGSPADRGMLQRMADVLEHRGPDERGVWVGTGRARSFGLASTRLSVIDLRGSSQPMSTADGRYVVSFNGEILNFRELRASLTYDWRTQGDTEVLLAAFARHGPAAFDLLAGQFACAVVDTVGGTLWLARDRLGILPLYWTDDGSRFAFASEPKALAGVTGGLTLEPKVLGEYLTRRAVPAPATMYAGISKLPAASYASIGAATGSGPVIRSYWQPPAIAAVDAGSTDDHVSRLDAALQVAVRRALVADVEVGAYLSGGLDSSLITALVVGTQPEGAGTHTFSAGFGDARTDELRYARLVADRLGTRHHEVHLRPEDYLQLWPQLSWFRDAPLSEPADVAVFRLAQTAREHVKVVLSGEGSDELFGGYPKHAYAGLTAAAARVPVQLRRPVAAALLRVLPPSARRMAVAARALGGDAGDALLGGWFASFTVPEVTRLIGRPVVQVAAVSVRDGDPLRRMLLDDCSSWLADNLLERADRMSMAASVEVRPPFLDRDLVDLAFSMPSNIKVRRGSGKWVLRQVARRYLPAEIVDRRKIGFRVPVDAWLRGGLRDLAWSLLTDPGSLCVTALDAAMVRRLLEEHDSGRRNHDTKLWTLMSLETWHRVCVLDGWRPLPPVDGGARSVQA